MAAITSIAYFIFQWFGQKWLENKFHQDLENFKYEKQRELESLKIQLSTRLDRATILNQKEFEILPSMYKMLNDAHGAIASFTSPLQIYADVESLNDLELDDLLSEQGFKDFEKNHIRESKPRAAVYQKKLFWKRINQVHEPYIAFHNYLLTNSIFLEPEIETKFINIRDLIWEAFNEARLEHQYDNPRPNRWEKREKLRENGVSLIEEIRDCVRTRLGSLSGIREPEGDA